MKKNSWLVILEISSERKRFMRCLDDSKSNEYVADFLENLLPIVAKDNWEEKLSFKNPTAKWSYCEPNQVTCSDSGCGNPILIAHKVENLIFQKAENEQKSIEFKSLKTQETLRYVQTENGDMQFERR